jgi:hypothetical protein
MTTATPMTIRTSWIVKSMSSPHVREHHADRVYGTEPSFDVIEARERGAGRHGAYTGAAVVATARPVWNSDFLR